MMAQHPPDLAFCGVTLTEPTATVTPQRQRKSWICLTLKVFLSPMPLHSETFA